MVKGPCRGKSCDYWARVKIRKRTLNELIAELQDCIVECRSTKSMKLDEALRKYWLQIGIRDMNRLCSEEPDLCAKMIDAEFQAQI
jgi:hypothetical protein